MSTTHQAAVGKRKGAPFELTTRTTPSAGPNQILVKVSYVAVNPVDHIMRDMGFQVAKFPVVLGSDAAGTVLAVGPNVTNVKVGDRVLAYCQAFAQKGHEDFGAFQETVLLPADLATPLPPTLPFQDAATLPLAIYTAATGFFEQLKVPREGFKPEDKKAVLVWGAGGSIGTVSVQVARILGFRVYAVASPSHHAYLKSLGAHACFDYKDPSATVSSVVEAVKADGLVLEYGYLATGDVSHIVAALAHFKSPNAKVASAPFSMKMLWWKVYNWSGVAVEFVAPPSTGTDEFYKFVYSDWAKKLLQEGKLVPSPKVEIVEGGLATGVQAALERLKAGVSGIKLVVKV